MNIELLQLYQGVIIKKRNKKNINRRVILTLLFFFFYSLVYSQKPKVFIYINTNDCINCNRVLINLSEDLELLNKIDLKINILEFDSIKSKQFLFNYSQKCYENLKKYLDYSKEIITLKNPNKSRLYYETIFGLDSINLNELALNYKYLKQKFIDHLIFTDTLNLINSGILKPRKIVETPKGIMLLDDIFNFVTIINKDNINFLQIPDSITDELNLLLNLNYNIDTIKILKKQAKKISGVREYSFENIYYDKINFKIYAITLINNFKFIGRSCVVSGNYYLSEYDTMFLLKKNTLIINDNFIPYIQPSFGFAVIDDILLISDIIPKDSIMKSDQNSAISLFKLNNGKYLLIKKGCISFTKKQIKKIELLRNSNTFEVINNSTNEFYIKNSGIKVKIYKDGTLKYKSNDIMKFKDRYVYNVYYENNKYYNVYFNKKNKKKYLSINSENLSYEKELKIDFEKGTLFQISDTVLKSFYFKDNKLIISHYPYIK